MSCHEAAGPAFPFVRMQSRASVPSISSLISSSANSPHFNLRSPMASSPLPSPSPLLPPPLPLLSDHSLDLASVRRLIARVNRHFNRFLSDPAARRALHLACGRALAVSHNAYFDFSDHSVLSNLYWGIDNVDAALLPGTSPGHRAGRLAAAEKMLQMPALLDEEGSTAGVHNRYLVCCAYFYLALARKLSGDQWQMIMHLLHSLLVSPGCFRKELAPALWRSLFSPSSSSSSSSSAIGVDDEIARQHVKKYKDWLMYYQVVSYGETPPWTRGSSDDEFGDREAESKYG